MALLDVYTFPDPILKQEAQPVTRFDASLKDLTESMLETMYESNGIGLAAVQVAILKQIVVIDLNSGSEETDIPEPHVFVNPNIVEKSGEIVSEEGCLSVVEFRADITRAQRVVVEYQDIEGAPHRMEAEDLMAICLQHECDHLQGILFIDYLPPLKQKMVKKRLSKQARLSA